MQATQYLKDSVFTSIFLFDYIQIINENLDGTYDNVLRGCKMFADTLPIEDYDLMLIKDSDHIYYLLLTYPYNKNTVTNPFN